MLWRGLGAAEGPDSVPVDAAEGDAADDKEADLLRSPYTARPGTRTGRDHAVLHVARVPVAAAKGHAAVDKEVARLYSQCTASALHVLGRVLTAITRRSP